METMDVTGMMSGLAGVIGAIAALLTAIVAFKNAKSSKPAQQHAPHGKPQGQQRPAAVQPAQFVQGVPNALQPKTQVSTVKLFARFAVSMVLAILLSMWFNSLYDYESPLGYVLAIVSVVVFFLACVYALRLLYRLLVSLFLR